jgi:hypothetical protein
VIAVAEGVGGEQDLLRAGAVEEGDTAARGVGAAVVQVQEQRRLARVPGEHLGGNSRKDAAGWSAVGVVVRDRLGGGVRRNSGILVAEVAGAERGGLGAG